MKKQKAKTKTKNKSQTALLNLLATGAIVTLESFHKETGMKQVSSLPNLVNRLRSRNAEIRFIEPSSFQAINPEKIISEVS